jgi:hypothetical protein
MKQFKLAPERLTALLQDIACPGQTPSSSVMRADKTISQKVMFGQPKHAEKDFSPNP